MPHHSEKLGTNPIPDIKHTESTSVSGIGRPGCLKAKGLSVPLLWYKGSGQCTCTTSSRPQAPLFHTGFPCPLRSFSPTQSYISQGRQGGPGDAEGALAEPRGNPRPAHHSSQSPARGEGARSGSENGATSLGGAKST